MQNDKLNEASEVTKKLLETGWQSWSVRTKPRFPFPHRNYAPSSDKSLVELEIIKKPKAKIFGWCSWYAYGSSISEQKIISQAKHIYKHKEILPLEYILIDDGWTLWGDWNKINSKKFPNGFAYLNEQLSSMNLKGGIWVAPFLVSPKSQIFKTKKEWLVRSKNKFLEGFKLIHPRIDSHLPYKKYVLDIKNPEVRKYLTTSIEDLINKNNFQLLKLDYLYAPYFDPNLKAEEATSLLKDFLKQIRKNHPDLHIIGSGLPLIPAVGNVDSMRIGPDIIIPHLDRIPLVSKIINTTKVHAAIRAIRNRYWTSDFWNIDPDVFVCRKSLNISSGLLLKLQKEIVRANGNIFLGDNLIELPEKRLKKFIQPLFEK